MKFDKDNDATYHGILISLGVIYQSDAETIAEELVRACDQRQLMRVAKEISDPCIKNLRKTINFLNARRNKNR